MGLELVERAIRGAMIRDGFEAILLLGDITDDGTKDYATRAFAEIRTLIENLCPGIPLLVVPGNHDGPADVLLDAFGQSTNIFDINGYRLIVFADSYKILPSGDVATRNDSDRNFLRELAAQPGGPIIVLQHNPMNPELPCDDYPFMLTNRREVMADYEAADVLLSISGHYHAGQPLSESGGVKYFTAAALVESPFAYYTATLTGRNVNIESHQLAMPAPPLLWDCHSHTAFAYCATDITAHAVIDRSKLMGLAGACLTEHGPQLYVSHEEFWHGRHVYEPALWRDNPACRMAEFRKVARDLRSDFVRVGLEIEADCEGNLILKDEDRDWPDILVGAVHWLMERTDDKTDAEISKIFLNTCQALLDGGVDVLAHPWRYFRRRNMRVPTELYPVLAGMLAETNTAAEINFHVNQPDPAFFAECIERGLKISFGSDSHAVYEAAAFWPHLEVLRTAAGTDDIVDLLFFPA